MVLLMVLDHDSWERLPLSLQICSTASDFQIMYFFSFWREVVRLWKSLFSFSSCAILCRYCLNYEKGISYSPKRFSNDGEYGSRDFTVECSGLSCIFFFFFQFSSSVVFSSKVKMSFGAVLIWGQVGSGGAFYSWLLKIVFTSKKTLWVQSLLVPFICC